MARLKIFTGTDWEEIRGAKGDKGDPGPSSGDWRPFTIGGFPGDGSRYYTTTATVRTDAPSRSFTLFLHPAHDGRGEVLVALNGAIRRDVVGDAYASVTITAEGASSSTTTQPTITYDQDAAGVWVPWSLSHSATLGTMKGRPILQLRFFGSTEGTTDIIIGDGLTRFRPL